jgi:hypothetical protein
MLFIRFEFQNSNIYILVAMLSTHVFNIYSISLEPTPVTGTGTSPLFSERGKTIFDGQGRVLMKGQKKITAISSNRHFTVDITLVH